MGLQLRLSILQQGGLLSKENYNIVLQIIEFLQNEHGFELNEENSAAFITHLCAALQRIAKGEEIPAIDSYVYESAMHEPAFERSFCISSEIQERYPILTDNEIKFITIHICALLASMQ